MSDDAERVRELGEIMREFDLDALRLRLGDAEYELVRRVPEPVAAPPASVAGTSAPLADGIPAAPVGPTAPAGVRRVCAPVVGVFYRAASPDAAPFVEIGDRVVPGQVLCILEAMKLMNEITSEDAGVVVRILPENGALVALGDDLMWIEP